MPEVGPPRLVRERDTIDLALEGGEWLGLAVFIYASGQWTVFEELSGGLALRPAESWLELAQGGDLCMRATMTASLMRSSSWWSRGGWCGSFSRMSRIRAPTWTSGSYPRKQDSAFGIGLR
jgi:hypothetical protein